jgi:6-phosphogluconate dehydrogenase
MYCSNADLTHAGEGSMIEGVEDPRDRVFEMIACIEQMIDEIKQYLDDCNVLLDDGKIWYALDPKTGKSGLK